MRFASIHILVLLGTIVLPLVAGCGDDEVGPEVELVTISGTVMNADTSTPQKNIKVSLHTNAAYADETATGDDGAYVIKVPKGSRLWLLTDDFNSGVDNFIPLINCDVRDIRANANIDGWIIHCCPQTSGQPAGSVAIWDDYLANCDDQNYGDIFNVTDSNSSGGNISISFFECKNGQFDVPDQISCSFDSPLAPVAYMDSAVVSFTDNVYATDCNIMLPGGGAMTDSTGWAMSFVDPAFTGKTLKLTLTDHNMPPYDFAFPMPVDVPVAPGTISLLFINIVDGVGGLTFKEFLQRCSF